MKRRSLSVACLLCAVLAVASSSPSAKKESLVNGSDKTAEKVNPLVTEAEEDDNDDDLLSRTKKSSTTTTFCVEIKPGNDQPTVVVCDPSKTDQQVPIPNQTQPPAPTHQHQPPDYHIPQIIPGFDADYQRGLESQPSSSPYEPLVIIPQQPQILQPQIFPPYLQPAQILSPYSHQPQIILVRDPNCPSNNPSNNPSINPSINQNAWQPSISPGRLYAPNPYARSSQYGMEVGDPWTSGYEPSQEALRSLSGSNFGGLFSNGYTNPLETIYSNRGNPQQIPLSNSVTLKQGPGLVNGNQNLEGLYNRPFVLQCNPKVVPLPQDAYAAGIAGKSNDQGFRTTGVAGGANQFMYQPPGTGHSGIRMPHDPLHHQQGAQTHNPHHHQMNAHPYNTQYKAMMSDYDVQGRAAEGSQTGFKGGQETSASMQQNQPGVEPYANKPAGHQPAGKAEQNSQPMFNGQGNHQGVSFGDGRGLSSQGQEQKMGSERVMGGSQNSGNHSFYPASIGKGQNSFANGDRAQISNGKDQGFQKQMGFPMNHEQQQQQQQTIPVTPHAAGLGQKSFQQTGSGDMSYSQMLLNRMKSAVGQGNLVQPYMTPPSDLVGDKQTKSKVCNH